MTMPMTLTLARKAPRATRILGLGLLLALIILPFLALLPADHPLAISVDANAGRENSLLCHCGGRAGSCVGLCRHALAGTRYFLCAGRVCDGNVPDAAGL